MELWAHIKGVDYPVALGATFNDEFSETLDSGSIIIPHVGLIDVKPYDDVIIHDRGAGNCPARPTASSENDVTGTLNSRSNMFYRHFLASDITRDRIYLDGDLFNYNISLFSETKGLEMVQLPNRTITNPKMGQGTGKTIWEWLVHFVSEYSPRIKISINNTEWKYVPKYRLDSAFMNTLSTLAPEQQWNLPTLKDVIHSLTITKGLIPMVKDGIITFLDLTKRNNLITNIEGLSWDTWSMEASSYCDRLRKTYSGSLSKDGTTTLIERLSFRALNSPTMDLSNMSLEFSHPIYKIKKLLLCYMAKKPIGTHTSVGTSYKNYAFTVKQDITKLVVTNSERNLLSIDWKTFQSNPPTTPEEMAKYKLCTIGYDIGSRRITGWGQRYSYPVGFFDATRTYIENIISMFMSMYPYGTSGSDMSSDDYVPDGSVITIDSRKISSYASAISDTAKVIVPTSIPEWAKIDDTLKLVFGNITEIAKNCFFECEYEGYIEGTTITSKDLHDGDVVKNDNVANSLSIVETEGSMAKEKVNRLGNETITKSARIDNNLTGLLQLADYTSDNEIMYRRSITLNKDYASVNYCFCKNYVLKNYFSSVYSRHRPFSLMSADESTTRSEVRYVQLLLSPDSCYYSNNQKINWYGDLISSDTSVISTIVSFYKATPYDEIYGLYDYSLKFNQSVYCSKNYLNLNDAYMTDSQMYVSGNALCCSMKMIDNITAGLPKIVEYCPYDTLGKSWVPEYANGFSAFSTTQAFLSLIHLGQLDILTGSTQSDYYLTGDTKTGFAENITMGTFSLDNEKKREYFFQDGFSKEIGSGTGQISENDVISQVYGNSYQYGILNYPKYPNVTEYMTPLFGMSSTFNYKDGREKIETTFEIEPICGDGVEISPYFMELSDVFGSFNKITDSAHYKKGFIALTFGKGLYQKSGETNHPFNPFINLYIPSNTTYDSRTTPLSFGSFSIVMKSHSDPLYPDGSITINLYNFKLYGKSGANNIRVIYDMEVTDGNTVSGTTVTYPNKELVLYKTEDNWLQLSSVFGSANVKQSQGNDKSVITYPACNVVEFNGFDGYAGVFMDNPYLNRGMEYQILDGYSANDILYDNTNDETSSANKGKRLVKFNTPFEFIVQSTPNIKWVLAPKVDGVSSYDAWASLPSDFANLTLGSTLRQVGVYQDEFNDCPILRTYFAHGGKTSGSIRMYFFDTRDEKWHFVWGQNYEATQGETMVETKCYLSLIEDRSKTVINPATGDGCGKVANLAKTGSLHQWGTGNYYDK